VSTMTINEVSKILGCTPEALKKWVRKLYPDLMKNGITTRLSQEHITRIKENMIPTTQVVGSVTDLEMLEKTASVIVWLHGRVKELSEENDELRPIAEAHRTLTESEGAITIAELSKILEIGEYKLFRALRANKILQPSGSAKNLPYQSYIDKGWFRVRSITIQKGDIKEINHQTLVTAKGHSEIAKLFPIYFKVNKKTQLELIQ
jgi:phage antirepressor YoqD-like protein